jgi:calcium/calmodulin-dependent protein kinase (CaM kinase) II
MNAEAETTIAEVLQVTGQLLDAIAERDWETYAALVDPQISAFEPEARGHLVEGLQFHRYYFDLPDDSGGESPRNTTMASPKVWLLGKDVAVVAYVRLTQKLQGQTPVTTACEETRVWRRVDGRWRHIHFHRSLPTA